MKRIYLFFSFLTISIGFLLYYFFRNDNFLIYEWFPFISKNNYVITDSHVILNIVRFNIPDGIWLFSGILFLRAIWMDKYKVFLMYYISFILFAFLFEFLQVLEFVNGTFDVFDLITMALLTLLEGIANKIFVTRRRTCLKECLGTGSQFLVS